jgi:hypothetical protein
VTRETRPLGPELTADGWMPIAGDSIMWCHSPSHQVVLLDGQWKIKTFIGWSLAPGEEASSDSELYAVSCYEAHDNREPSSKWDGFLTASYAKALRAAVATRAAIVAGQKRWAPSKQLTLDDLLVANGGSL